MTIKNEILVPLYVVAIMVMLGGMAIFGQLVRINVVDGDHWRQQLDSNYVRIQPVRADRGSILDANGDILAASIPQFELRMDFGSNALEPRVFADNVDSLAWYLSKYVNPDKTPEELSTILKQEYVDGTRYWLIKKNATYPELERIRTFPILRLGQFKGGFIVRQSSRRTYPFRGIARRTLGYVKDSTRFVGLEGSFQKELAGKPGKEFMIRSGGDLIPLNDLTQIAPQDGDDIVTTLEVDLQDAVHTALLRGLNAYDADQGAAILMEVETGAIKAISNLGRVKNGWAEIYNYAVGLATPPGSTFKTATMLALLENGGLSLEDSVKLEHGVKQFYDEELRDASAHGLESATVRQTFQISSNVGMATLVEEHFGGERGANRFVDYLKDYYLHLPTGIEIDGEASPYLKRPFSEEDQWSGITLPWMSIGYEMKLTPLQVLNFYNTIANDGTMMKPYLVSRVERYGEVVESYRPTMVKRRIATKKSIRKVQELLKGVVEVGTASKIRSDEFSLAGKTGTTQANYNRNKQDKIKYQASFVGYFPAEKPVYSCIVVIYNPKKELGYYGSEVAAPVFREIADKCYALSPELGTEINTYAVREIEDYLPSGNAGNNKDFERIADFLDFNVENKANLYAKIKSYQDTLWVLNRSIEEKEVPNVVGMGLRDALYILENQKLKVRFSGTGKVIRQSIKPGTAAKGQTVFIKLS